MNNNHRTTLITGGAGYIGSHVIIELIRAGRRLVVIDNLSRGVKQLVPKDIPLVVGDIANKDLVRSTIQKFKIDSVIHLAGSIVVPESVAVPLLYYENNVENSRRLVEVCIEAGVDNLIFASTAAVYGPTKNDLLNENSATNPVNPYGKSKLITEWIIKDAAAAHKLNYIMLRFFNVAGADDKLRSGQIGRNNTHLIKVACEVAHGSREYLEIFGTDYPTPDGTCIRDYVHVSDLALALIESLNYLDNGGSSAILNCGYGKGISVRQVINSIIKIQKNPINVIEGNRRAGDVAKIIADTSLIQKTLNWKPKFGNIDQIVNTAFKWELSGKAVNLLYQESINGLS